MVLIRIRIHYVLRVLQICGAFTSTWPPDPTATKREIFFRDLSWFLSIMNVLSSIPPLILGAWYSRNDIIQMMKSLSELTALMEVLFNLILCKIERLRLQKLLAKISDFFKYSELHEKHTIQKYIDRYSNFSAVVGISYILAAITFSCGPFFLPINLPMEAWYPFPTDSLYVRSILYISQVLAILQTGFCITVDFMIAMFFWYSAARLDMLGLELQHITHENQIKTCIQKHQEIISFVDEVQYTVRYLICKSNITMACATICGGFPLLYKQPLAVTAQFICMVVGGCERLYITAWPADDLAEISEKIAWNAYNMPWFKRAYTSHINMRILMQRSRKPLIISMGNIFPVLSIQYYAKFLKTISSYFMTMRAVIAE
ncbi:ObirOr5-G1 [Ooceraea biroi]|uniref:Odorant receptor n=1 Tax=Ooceraea biroi TaxID=2015173 RepID=A0A3L8DNI6_OOCBI|nr:odorant receptor 49b-like isoform X2 [Ooceraea biroi]RLU22005.1 ObirOr5-G1 [Ooceraea biroi]